jgi:hypothetical protein
VEGLAGAEGTDGKGEGLAEGMVRFLPLLPLSNNANLPLCSVEGKHRVLLVPDKDADGLSSGLILSLALKALSHPPSLIQVYHLPRGSNVHSDVARDEMMATFAEDGGPTRAVVLDQGSRPGPALLPEDKTKVLLIDHHLSTSFPEGSTVLSACHSLPVATTSLLTYLLCCELVPSLAAADHPAGMAALLGIYGDLGSSKPTYDVAPWPVRLAPIEKALTKSALGKAVAMLNAPRRTPEFNVADAYEAIEKAATEGGGGAKGILKNEKLLEAKERTSAETSRWQGAPPVFSKDGAMAVIKIDSGYQGALFAFPCTFLPLPSRLLSISTPPFRPLFR